MRKRIDDLTLAYDDHPGPEPALVLLHAFPLNRSLWDPQVAALRGQRRIVVPDLRGHGESDAPPGIYSMDLLAADLVRLLDALGVRDLVLGGISMGGYVAFAFWRQASARVRGLVLADTRATADSPEGRRAREELAQLAERAGARAVAERQVARLLAPSTLQHKPELVERVRQMIETAPVAGIAAASRGMADRPNSLPLLGAIDVPALVVVGAEDALTPPDEARLMAEKLPNAELVVIPDAGHLSNLEQPERFNAVLAQFLARIGTRAGTSGG